MVRMTIDLKDRLKDSLKKLSISTKEITLEHPQDPSFGDCSTNVALLHAKEAGKSPVELAQKIIDLFKKPDYVKDIQVAGPGFINFFFTRSFFTKKVEGILDLGSEYGKNEILSGKKVIIEYTDPNPFKELHIGHLMSNAIGESVSRMLEFSGGEVKRANYQGDVGLHVAKAVWGMKRGEADLGRAYAEGAKAYEESERTRDEIIDINQKIYDGGDEEINKLYKNGREESLERFESIYTRLGTKFDFYFFESETGKLGKKIVEEGVKKGIFEKSDGTIVYRGERKGLHTRVFYYWKRSANI